MIYQPQPR